MHDMGRNCDRLVALLTFGINVTNVAFTCVGITSPSKKDLTTLTRSTPIISQNPLKKAPLNPSGPGLLSSVGGQQSS